MKTILVTGVGAPGGPGILKSLNRNQFKLIGVDNNKEASGRFLVDHFYIVPRPRDKDYVDILERIVVEHNVNLIIPLVTAELTTLSKIKGKLKRHNCEVLVSNLKDLEIANNKFKLQNHIKNFNIATTDYCLVKTYDDFLELSNAFLDRYGEYCIKPCDSNGSRGVRIVKRNLNELHHYLHSKPNNLNVSHESMARILCDQEFPHLMISKVLNGPEVTIDCLCDRNGTPKIIIPRTRNQMRNGISIAGTFVNNKKIINYCKKILSTLKLFGPIGVQVKGDNNGEYYLLEVNPRLQGTSVAARGAGVNLTELSVNTGLGIDNHKINVKWGVSFVRIYDEIYF